jgi:hypothetical protein
MDKPDPVTAISEAEATGEIAEMFTDIRETMQIPLVTSIWRMLAHIEGGLSALWEAAKPIFQTGLPAVALVQLLKQVKLPIPEPFAPGQLACSGVSRADLEIIRTLIGAYNRSNGMNLLALAALVVPPSGKPPPSPTASGPRQNWPELPSLQAPEEIDPAIWQLLEHLNRIGKATPPSGIATLWRHLSHWPGLLAVIYAGLMPLHSDGSVEHSKKQIKDFVRREGGRLAHLRPGKLSIPEEARQLIEEYAIEPGRVVRMVSIGHGLARWLETE